jgi:hypothetical protein
VIGCGPRMFAMPQSCLKRFLIRRPCLAVFRAWRANFKGPLLNSDFPLCFASLNFGALSRPLNTPSKNTIGANYGLTNSWGGKAPSCFLTGFIQPAHVIFFVKNSWTAIIVKGPPSLCLTRFHDLNLRTRTFSNLSFI